MLLCKYTSYKDTDIYHQDRQKLIILPLQRPTKPKYS